MKLNNLSFGFSELLFDAVDLEIEAGKILGVLGANGAGKSTLLRLLNGSLSCNSGEVLIDGSDVKDMSIQDIACYMAMVPQNPSAQFGFTVSELVSMGRRPHQGLMNGVSNADVQIVKSVLSETGLDELKDRRITELSGGELQLAFVARALAQEPKVLLMDEATSSLDINHTSQILTIVRQRVKEQGLTVISVIHDINEALSFCDNVVLPSRKGFIGPKSPSELINDQILSDVYGVDKSRIQVHKDPMYVECKI